MRSFVSTALLALLSTSAALLSDPAYAQGCGFQPDADPSTGPASTNPFGTADPNDLNATNQSLVFRIDPANLPAQRTILGAIGFCALSDREYHFSEISIRLGHSTDPTPNTILSQNFIGFTAQVMQAGDWTWRPQANQWSFIGLTSTFTYDPSLGSLVVQITTGGAVSTGNGALGFHSDPTHPNVLQTGWRFAPGRGVIGTGIPKIRLCWDAADLQTFGGGCPGSNSLIPQIELSGSSGIGDLFTLSLRDAPPTSPLAFLIIDYRVRATPFDLTPFGAPGCDIRIFWDLFFEPFALTNGGRDLNLQIPPEPFLIRGRAWCQWLPFDPTLNTLGFSTSNIGRILIGS